MIDQQISVEGMSCQHCVMALTKTLSQLSGLEIKEVTVGSARYAIDESKVSREQIAAAVEEAGFTLIGLTPAAER